MRSYGIYQNIRDRSWRCLIDNKISSLPVDVLKIAENSNVRVIKNSIVNVLLPNENGRSYYDGTYWYIVYNDLNPVEISRFTIAHELGHYFLGHELKYVKYAHTREIAPKPKSEIQADRFAIRLLCPACVLWGLDLHTPNDIARYCKVDLDVATQRTRRMKFLYDRNKFFTNPLEQEVYNQFQSFIQSERSVNICIV